METRGEGNGRPSSNIPRTEASNPLTAGLDTWDAVSIVEAINAEDHRIAPAVHRELPRIARAAELAAGALSAGHRIVYVGAGTSGRIGVLDASEMEPTYGDPGKRFVALIAGGRDAVFSSVEGAEDSVEAGEEIVRGLDVGTGDLVLGIAASGGTPFVAGALNAARERGASTVAVVGDPSGAVGSIAQVVIAPDVGPEVVTGSTRMKNGTAQKMVLNMISTAAMVMAGRTYSNLMAGVSAKNAKLSGRARRILMDATGKSGAEVEQAYLASGGDVAASLVSLRRGVSPEEAAKLLIESNGVIRKAADGDMSDFRQQAGSASSEKDDATRAPSRTGSMTIDPSLTEPSASSLNASGLEATFQAPALRFGSASAAGLNEAQVERAFAVLRDAVGDGEGEIPCAVGTIVHRGKVIGPRAFGWAVREPVRIPATPSTIFDMASLTKVTAMTPSILILCERGLVRLDDAVSTFIPEFARGNKDNITVRHLLTHTSGLPAHIKYWQMGLRGREIIRHICDMELPPEPGLGSEVVYSDLGFIILAELLRRVTGQTMDRFAAKEVFGPLGMTNTGYLPPAEIRNRVAATEYRADLGRVMWGEVHDENTLALGGISGHAGLFSTAEDIARYVLMWLGGGAWQGVRVLSRATVVAATSEETSAGERRGLGWMLKSHRFSSGGDLFSASSYGHTGFTGTSIWCDPETETAAILLTNRVHAGRDGKAIIRLRPRFANAVAAAVR